MFYGIFKKIALFPDHIRVLYSAEMAQESRGQPRREQFRARMAKELGEASAAALDEALRSPASEKRSLRLNSLRSATPSIFEACGFDFLEPIKWEPSAFWVKTPSDLDTAPAIGAGLGYLQEAGAMEVVNVLNPVPGDLVLDLCAAPGGKSTQILEKLGPSDGWLVCNDPVRSRAERLNALTARHGSSRVSVLSQDPDSLRDRFEGVFDKILIDAPCSGESFFAKRDDKRLDVTDAEVAGCARRQFLILDRAAQMCRPGGQMVYSTCTYSRAENSDLVQSFLDVHPEFELVKEQYRFPHVDGVPGGYWAKLQHKGQASERPYAQLSSVSGLLRESVVNWNAEIDQYALAMLAESMPVAEFNSFVEYPVSKPKEIDKDLIFVAGFVDLDDEQARKFLSGQSISITHKKGLCVLRWKNHALGIGKSTGDRINNLLPKVLRAIR